MDKYQQSYTEQLAQSEFSWLKKRRQQAKLTDSEQENTTGLALSGGGIRSATFNLGVLQALEKHQQLTRFDYLSSVSGGGYVASSLTWFKSRLPNQFPFGTDRTDHNKLGGSILSWLRSHSNFLTPGNGINKTSLLTALLTGTFINLLIILPVFALFLFFLTIEVPFYLSTSGVAGKLSGFYLLQTAGRLLLTLSVIVMLITALSTGFSSASSSRRTEHLRRLVSALFSWGVLLVALGFTPLYHQYFERFSQWLVHASFSMSLFGILVSWYGASLGKERKTSTFLTSSLISTGLIITSIGVFVLSYHVIKFWSVIPLGFYPLLLLSLLLAVGCNINLVSMHGYYRNRLRDAFMPYKLPQDDNRAKVTLGTWSDAQHCALDKLTPTDMPYQLINCNIELCGSTQPKYRTRACDSFTLSPLYCGSSSTGYAQTSQYMQGKMDLATACAISGAAVATNTRQTRSKALSFLMALLNLRLGCWLDNPKNVQYKIPMFNKPWWYVYMFRDMFGRGLNENQSYVHLSDGGHFENLGIYELVRRKCKLIYAIDASADPKYQFSDLARVTELIRVDFGAKLAIDISNIQPRDDTLSSTAWAKGEICYEDGSKAELIYIKPCLLSGLSEDVYGYQRQNPSFPHQSTADQFFNEAQFEAYRELGFQITHQLCKANPQYMNAACQHQQ